MALPGNLKRSQRIYDLHAANRSTNKENTETRPYTQEGPYKQKWRPTSNISKQIIHLEHAYRDNEYHDYLALVPREQLLSRLIKIQSEPSLTKLRPSDYKTINTNKAKLIEAMKTDEYKSKIIISPPGSYEEQESTPCLIKNRLGQWFFEDNGERKSFPDIGELEIVHCHDIDDENASALLIIGTKNLALIKFFEGNSPPEKNNTEKTDCTTSDDIFENICDTDLSDKNNGIQKWINEANPEFYLHDNEPVHFEINSESDSSYENPDDTSCIIEGADEILKHSLFHSYTPLIEPLLENKFINPENNISEYGTLLHTATKLCYPDTIKTVIEKKYVDINQTNNNKATAIIMACTFNDNEVKDIGEKRLNILVGRLLSYKPDLSLKDNKQQTALDKAIEARYPLSTIKLLLDAGADITELKEDLYSELDENSDGDEYFTTIKGLSGWLKGAGI